MSTHTTIFCTSVRQRTKISLLAICAGLLCSCVVSEGPGGAVVPGETAVADGLVGAGAAAADIGLAAAASGGFWGGGGWWGGGSSYEQNNFYNYNGRRDGYRRGDYRNRGYGSYRGGGHRGGGYRGGGRR